MNKNKKPSKTTEPAIAVDTVLATDVCYHLLRDRVRTHRGYHCGNCGKRF